MLLKKLGLVFPIIIAGLVLAGGVLTSPVALAATEADFTEIVWTRVANQPYANAEGQGVILNGRLYSFGGFDALKPCCTPTRRAYYYTPETDTWTRITDLPKGLTHGGFATDGVRYVYYAGGYIENATQTGQIFGTRQVWRYDALLDVYSALPELPKINSTGSMALVNGKLHYLGGTIRGSNGDPDVDLPDHYTFDLNAYASNLNEKWVDITETAPLPNPRQLAGIHVMGGLIYYIGGQHEHDGQLVPQNDVHTYNPVTGVWTQVADLPEVGLNHIGSSAMEIGGRLIVVGGQSWSCPVDCVKDTVLAYDPATNTWSELTPLPVPQFSGVGGVLNGALYYSGGSKNWDSNYKRATWKGVPVLLDATAEPTDAPTEVATDMPTEVATDMPTEAATDMPTEMATDVATEAATEMPTEAATDAPTEMPTDVATDAATGVATDTPTDMATDAATGVATDAPTEMATDAPTSAATNAPTTVPTTVPTADATGTPVSATELLLDGSFEFDADGDKLPDAWKLKQPSGDRLICKPARVAVGLCAFQFKGGAGEASSLTQTVDIAMFSFAAGDTLDLSGYWRAKPTVAGKIKVIVKYADTTPKSVINLQLPPTSGYEAFSGAVTLGSGSIAKLKVIITHRSLTGKTLVDGLSLKLNP